MTLNKNTFDMTFLLSSAVKTTSLFTLGFLIVMPIFITVIIIIKARKNKKKKQ